MNLINIFKKYSLIIVLALIVFSLIAIKLFYKPKTVSDEVILVPTPTSVPTEIPINTIFSEDYIKEESSLEKSSKESQNNFPLWSKLPYKQDDFIVDHYTKPMTLLVKIKDESKKGDVKNKINEWLKENNFNIGSHQIEWKVVENF